MATVAPKFTLPQEPRRYKFVLTPLADAMFQLLIFFMLSSSLAPYALMTIRSSTAPETFANTGPTEQDTTATATGDVAIWSVSAEGLRISGQSFGYDALSDLASAIAGTDTSVVLIVRESAVVQDLVRVVEALTAAGVSNVQIAGQTS